MAAAAVGVLGAGSAAQAMTVEPLEPYTSDGGQVHYASLTSVSAQLDSIVGFRSINLTVGASGDAVTDPGDGVGLLQFDLLSTRAVQVNATQRLVIVATINHSQISTGGGSRERSFVPIAAVNGTLCSSSGVCQGEPNLTTFPGSTLGIPYAVRYTVGNTLRIGIYPRDICEAMSRVSPIPVVNGTPSPCNSDGTFNVPDATAGTPRPVVTMSIDFHVGVAPDTASLPDINALTDSQTVVLTFHDQDAGAVSGCPAATDDIYFPSDHSILLDASKFSADTSDSRPPLDKLFVVGNDGAAPNTTLPGALTANEITARVVMGGTRRISGFTNSDAVSHPYQLSFAVINRAGVFTNSFCGTYQPVFSSSVNGFLEKGNCFIATAAFGSQDASPVRMLRALRDRVLWKNRAGRLFVHWYYSWSSDAADWIKARPILRLPLLSALAPVQALAWLLLHPLLAGALATAGAGVVLFGSRGRRS